MVNKMDINFWMVLQSIEKCFMCKKFKEPLYVKNESMDGSKFLNVRYLAHLKMTHGISPEFIVDWIAEQLYKSENDRNKMRELYNFLDI